MKYLLTLITLVIFAFVGWIVIWGFEWGAGKWVKVNKCVSCGYANKWPYMYHGNPCTKCGET